MKDEGKTKARLPDEVITLRQQVANLQAAIAAHEHTKETLHDREQHYRIISEMISDYAYAARIESDWTYTVEWFTQTFTRVTGYTLERGPHSRNTWKMFIHPDDLSVAYERGQKLMAGQADVREFRIITKSGEVRWVHEFGRPIWDEAQGRVTQLYIAGRDITERKRMEETRLQASEKVHAGEPYIDSSLLTALLEELAPHKISPAKDPEAAKIATLAAREREVIALIGEGLRNMEIAKRLFISETKVRHHLTSIFSKLEVADRLELVIYAFQHGLATLPF